MNTPMTNETVREQTAILATNKVIRNTYTLPPSFATTQK